MTDTRRRELLGSGSECRARRRSRNGRDAVWKAAEIHVSTPPAGGFWGAGAHVSTAVGGNDVTRKKMPPFFA